MNHKNGFLYQGRKLKRSQNQLDNIWNKYKTKLWSKNENFACLRKKEYSCGVE